MDAIIVLLHLLMQDPDARLPEPEVYLEIYCTYHTHSECGDDTDAQAEPASEVTRA